MSLRGVEELFPLLLELEDLLLVLLSLVAELLQDVELLRCVVGVL